MVNDKGEIDLIELMIKIYLYFRKYWYILALGVVAGVAFTFFQNMAKPKSYESSMLLSVKKEQNYMYAITFKEMYNRKEQNVGEVVADIIGQANKMLENENFEQLAERMHLKPTDLNGLKSISAVYSAKEDNEVVKNSIMVNAVSSKKEVFHKLGRGIETLVNQNKYIKNKTSEDSLMLCKIIAQIDKKNKVLDSLLANFFHIKSKMDLFIYQENSFFGESVMLSSLRENLRRELQHIQYVRLIEDFYVPAPKEKSLKSSFGINIIIFLFLSVFIVFFIIFRNKVKNFEQNR